MVKIRSKESVLPDIVLALVLLMPVILLYLSHYLAFIIHPEFIPTGFLQLDQAFYMASAREYLDHSSYSLLYANPTDSNPTAPAIYFQLPILILSVLLKITGMDPSLLFNLFGLFSAWGCIYICIRFWREYTGQWEFTDKLGLLLFIWGGGILIISGFLWSVIDTHAGDDPFIFDPTHGWWFLNWGRNLVLPLEAFYHLLFMGMVWSIFSRKYKLSLLFPVLLALSHPFTGLQAMLIYFTWITYERFYAQNKSISVLWVVLAGIAFGLHLLYYLVFLPSIPSHLQVQNQWKLSWNLSPFSALLAYLPVLLPALYVLFNKKSFKISLVYRHFLIIWLLVSLLLVFNNLIFEGFQPLHFTRGYLWLALFLLAFPWLKKMIVKILSFNLVLRFSLISLLTLGFLSDNIAWFISSAKIEIRGTSFQLNKSQQHIIDYLKVNGKSNDLLLSDDIRLAYFSIVYSPVRTIYSHWANTPDALKKVGLLSAFRNEGKRDSTWVKQQIYFLRDLNKPATIAFVDTLSMHFTAVDTCLPLVLYYQKKE